MISLGDHGGRRVQLMLHGVWSLQSTLEGGCTIVTFSVDWMILSSGFALAYQATFHNIRRNYQQNYYTAFRKAALIFVTHSRWGGWHHVEIHDDNWWQVKMEAMGFVYSEILTSMMKQKAIQDKDRRDLVELKKKSQTPNRTRYNVAQHLRTTLQVFINPLVASLPEHAHLFAEHGCLKQQECGKEGLGGGVSDLTPLPESFRPLPMTKEMDDQWMDLIKDMPVY
ncbi:hypothetical protein ACHAXR_003932 [Thalassiosira sp. AJA248-18]